MRLATFVSALALSGHLSSAFTLKPQRKASKGITLSAGSEFLDSAVSSRRHWLSKCVASAPAFLVGVSVARAEGDESMGSDPPSPYSIQKCSTSTKAACVSTANVRNLDLYRPPWTFSVSTAEAMSRLKGSIAADPACEIVKQDGNLYLKVEAKRSDLFGSVDTLEFVVNGSDQVITFRSSSNNDTNDLGANKRRLDEIRKRAGVFGLMGDTLNTADSATIKGNGPLGQLKAFYGLQSGGGFEDIVLDLDN